MPKVRGNPSDKWQRRASVAQQDYKDGVAGAGQEWQANTLAAASNHTTATQASLARGAFAAGVKRVGPEKWQRKSETVGAERFSQGVAAATTDYEQAVGPYLDTIETTKLPPRGPKGDPNNINRVIALNKALRDKKLSIQGGGR